MLRSKNNHFSQTWRALTCINSRKQPSMYVISYRSRYLKGASESFWRYHTWRTVWIVSKFLYAVVFLKTEQIWILLSFWFCQFFVLYLLSVKDRAQSLWVASSTTSSSDEVTVKVSLMVIFEVMSWVWFFFFFCNGFFGCGTAILRHRDIFPILLTHKVDKYIQYHGWKHF